MQLFTVPEVCEKLRVGRTAIYKLAGDGRLRLTKIGGRTVVRDVDLEIFLNRHAPVFEPAAPKATVAAAPPRTDGKRRPGRPRKFAA
jgi:excisionase family DNA binding protein